MFLLDTNVVSELRKISVGRGERAVLEWARGVDQSLTFISSMTIYEIEIGVRSAERRDPAHGLALRRWLETRLAVDFTGRIIPVDGAVAKTAAGLNVPNRRPFIDGMIAATALLHGFTVVTRNTVDFEGAGVRLLDPWVALKK